MESTDTRKDTPSQGSVQLALRYYGRELLRLRWLTVPAMLLPAVGNIGINYVAPLVVAKLVGRISDDAGGAVGPAVPYVLVFTGVLLLAEACWRIGIHCPSVVA